MRERKLTSIILKTTTILVLVSLLFFASSCSSSSFNYNDSTQKVVDWFYDSFSDNNNFEILSIDLVDNESEYIYYAIDFQMDYDTYTDEGVVTGEGIMLYFVHRDNPTVVIKFNINSSSSHQSVYNEYLNACDDVEAYKYSFTDSEIEDMLLNSADKS